MALFVAVSAALGPTLASLILSVARWPWLFLINVPLGAAAVPLRAGASRDSSESQPRASPRALGWRPGGRRPGVAGNVA